jgi:hypothetical protein
METLQTKLLPQRQVLLNLGCGQVRPEKWINTDPSLNSLAQSIPLLRLLVTKRSLKKMLKISGFRNIVTESYGHSHHITEISDADCTAEEGSSVYLEAKVIQ